MRLAAQRRKPQVTLQQLLVGRIEQGVVKYQATFHYNILYSGVKSLRIDVPAALVALGLRNKTPAIRDKVMDPQPADVAKGYSAWSFSGEAELLGKGDIELVWERTDREAGRGQERRSRRAAAGPAGRRFARLGADRADQGGNARRAGIRRAQGTAAHRSAARPGPPGRRRRQGLRVSRRLDLAHHRHPVPIGEGQADEHRPRGGADGGHAGGRGQRAGDLPRAKRPAAAGGQAAQGQVRLRAAAGGRPAGAAGDGQAGAILRARPGPQRRPGLPAGVALHGLRRRQHPGAARLFRRRRGRPEGLLVRLPAA